MEIRAIKGFKDILPGEVEAWQLVEDTAREVFAAFGFSEIKLPTVEATELFARGIGETTDIVEKEMYSFTDRDGKGITLRPEGTASAVRAYIEHQLWTKDPITKIYYSGPMFRHERPQAGRLRQFYQIGAEALGVSHPMMDVEILVLLFHLFERLGVPSLRLEINSLGCPNCRPTFRQLLMEYLQEKRPRLCESCQKRYATNPLRILDCKEEGCRRETDQAPAPRSILCPECYPHFQEVEKGLSDLGIPYYLQDRLVRGLDYYTKTTFEWTSPNLGAQNAVAAGGRYDGLVESLGGPPTPGIGFAIGIERLVSLLDKKTLTPPGIDLYCALLGEENRRALVPVIFQLRRMGVRTEYTYGETSLKSQIRRADKLGARWVVIIGEEERKKNKALIRDMNKKTQEEVDLSSLLRHLLALVEAGKKGH